MSKQKSCTEITVNEIQKVVDEYGYQSDITKNYIQAKIAINLALISDYLIEIHKSERRREIDMDKFIFGEEISKETDDGKKDLH